MSKLQARRDGPPNAAHPTTAHAGAADLAARASKLLPPRACPLPGAHKAVGLWPCGGHVQQQRSGRIGYAVVESHQGVTHGNAPALASSTGTLSRPTPKLENHLDRGQSRQVLRGQANGSLVTTRIKLAPVLAR